MSRPQLISLISTFFLFGLNLNAAPSLSPERETLEISKRLKGVSDDEWNSIAGPQALQNYQVGPGDTLYGISERLFGDGKYWPKIWAINHEKISNPHKIQIGNLIAFQSGTGASLPSVAFTSSPTAIEPVRPGMKYTPQTNSRRRSNEWQALPKQPWELTSLQLPSNVDPQGFDLRNNIRAVESQGFEIPQVAATDRIPILGEITGSRSESSFLSLNDIVYIKAEDEIKVGKLYSITQEPITLSTPKSDRQGLGYSHLGSIKVIGERDGIHIARIESVLHPINRGSLVVPLIQRVKDPDPIPADSALSAVLVINRSFSTFTTAQHRFVYVDRGSSDGVKPGMIFRAYQYFDPSNDERITSADFIIEGDFKVVQVSPTYSLALAIRTFSPISDNASLVLLTDVSEFFVQTRVNSQTIEDDTDGKLDDLDLLDNGDGLTREEKKTLKQLEDWEGNPENIPSAIEETAPLPIDGLLEEPEPATEEKKDEEKSDEEDSPEGEDTFLEGEEGDLLNFDEELPSDLLEQ